MLYTISCNKQEGLSSANKPTLKAERSYPVKVVKTKPISVELTIRAVGSLLADEAVPIRARVEERVEEILAEEGDYVEKGELLVVFYEKKIHQELLLARAFLAEVKADYENSKITLKRKGTLLRREMVSQQDYDDSKTRVELTKARVDQARADLGLSKEKFNDTRIKAPLPGFIQERFISPGQYMEVGDKLFMLIKTDPIKLEFAIPERETNKVKVTQKVRFGVQAYPDDKFYGDVYYIAPAADSNSRMVTLKAYVPNKDAALKPGFFADVEVIVGIKDKALFVPEGAIVFRGKKPAVFLYDNGIAKLKGVSLGVRQEGLVEIISGIKPGEKIVTDGGDMLDNGFKVNIIS